MSATADVVLEEVRRMTRELKSFIEAVETRISNKVEEISKRITSLEKENLLVLDKLEELDRKGRENSVIIFGLKHPKQIIPIDFITGELKKVVGVDVKDTDLNNYYPLGKTDSCPIKVDFVSFLKKSQVLRQSKLLKGTTVTIANDMTVKQRLESSVLRKHLQIAKQDQNSNCFIKKNRLHVNDQVYTVEQLEIPSDTVEELEVASAPGTSVASTATIPELPNRNAAREAYLKHIENSSNISPSPSVQVSDGNLKEPNTQLKQKKEILNKNNIETRSKIKK